MNGTPISRDAAQLSLEVYRDALSRAAREQGELGARIGDPLGFDRSVESICQLAATGAVFTADDVRVQIGVQSNAVGAAFAHARRARVIQCVGFTTSKMPSRHGAVVRLWRGGT